jgi:hypothetical protein
MIADMRLDRPPSRPVLANRGIRGIDPEEPRAMLNDERRAVLAVWYLNSRFVVSRILYSSTIANAAMSVLRWPSRR